MEISAVLLLDQMDLPVLLLLDQIDLFVLLLLDLPVLLLDHMDLLVLLLDRTELGQMVHQVVHHCLLRLLLSVGYQRNGMQTTLINRRVLFPARH